MEVAEALGKRPAQWQAQRTSVRRGWGRCRAITCSVASLPRAITITNFAGRTKVCAKKCVASDPEADPGPTVRTAHASTAGAPRCVESPIFGHLGRALDQSQLVCGEMRGNSRREVCSRVPRRSGRLCGFRRLACRVLLVLAASRLGAHPCLAWLLNLVYLGRDDWCFDGLFVQNRYDLSVVLDFVITITI